MFKYWFIDEVEEKNLIKKYSFINGLKFDFVYKTTSNQNEYYDLENIISPWLIQLRTRLHEMQFTIINFLYFYDMNIDDRTVCELGESDKGFFPNLSEKEKQYKFISNYFYGNFQIQYISILDALYHILNIYYDANIENHAGFGKSLIEKLKDKNQGISLRLEEFWNECKINAYRNDKIHNYDPNIPDKGYDETEKGTKVYYCPRYIHLREKYKLLEVECIKMADLLRDIKRYMIRDTNKHLSRNKSYKKPNKTRKSKKNYYRKRR